MRLIFNHPTLTTKSCPVNGSIDGRDFRTSQEKQETAIIMAGYHLAASGSGSWICLLCDRRKKVNVSNNSEVVIDQMRRHSICVSLKMLNEQRESLGENKKMLKTTGKDNLGWSLVYI